MRLAFFLGGENAGAFHDDIDIRPGQVGRIFQRGDLHAATADVDPVFACGHGGGKPAMDRIIAQQMRVGLDRTQIVDRHDLDILAAGLHDRAQHVATDPPKSVDGNFDRHDVLPRYDFTSRLALTTPDSVD
jgi:hypothetical protein